MTGRIDHNQQHHRFTLKDQVVCHGDTRVTPSKEGQDPYAEPKARGIFVKVALMGLYHFLGFTL